MENEFNMPLKERLRLHLSNMAGKRLTKKIVVIESDDWGSIRTASAEAYRQMSEAGIHVNHNHYGYDALESNDDLEKLFNLLTEFKDSTGRPPVFTPVCMTANPDFDRIKASGYQTYFYQTLEETLKEYPAHNLVLEYWKKGVEERLFVPQLHGREHLNVRRYMQLLGSADEGFMKAFELRSVGVSGSNAKEYPNYLGALHPVSREEIPELHGYLEDAGNLFEKYMGYRASAFVAPNAEEPKELEKTLHKIGIRYITRAKIRKYPLGDGEFKTEFNWPGKQNSFGQIILVRNAFFEPVCFGEPDKAHITDWVNRCMKDIEIAFQWKKPAVISSHRVNYIGQISPQNSEKGLKELHRLLKAILTRWPEVEFMTSTELGEILRK